MLPNKTLPKKNPKFYSRPRTRGASPGQPPSDDPRFNHALRRDRFANVPKLSFASLLRA